MWWEALPSLALVCVGLSFPSIYNYVSNYVVLGTPHHRLVYTKLDGHAYLRDQRLNNNGSPYVQKGLDSFEGSECQEVRKTMTKKTCECPEV